ncbi:hypothetical protein BC834DRAFT_974070 [Gloeopeniophorella convolvens]|nr:hypothetical protein BC834DRAFT_974070 [Gloeopeniophorella convolvens]
MSSLNDELAALRSQAHEATERQQTLNQAVAEKRTKVGNVEILCANLQKARFIVCFSIALLTWLKTVVAHNEEMAELRAVKESLEATQLAAQKKQEAELKCLHT